MAALTERWHTEFPQPGERIFGNSQFATWPDLVFQSGRAKLLVERADPFGNYRRSVRGKVAYRHVRRTNRTREAIVHQRADARERLFEISAAIVNARQQMAVQIDQASNGHQRLLRAV